MPTSELVRYSGPKSRELQLKASDSSSFGSGGEDWITRKRVETKTVKNIEKRIQRQVVLEDGRVIEEDDPEVTVDTIEDIESHSDDCDDDVKHIGALVHVSMNEASPWTPGYNVVGDKLQRNIFTNKVDQKSVTTACGNNLGDIKVKDLDGILKRGKKVSSLVTTKGYEEDPGKVEARIVHKDAARKKTVDVEDIQEIDQMNATGQHRSHRIVNRECIEDNEEETPSDGESTEETESRDGDRDAFSQRKEDRTIDYFKVPKGKSMNEAKFLRRGLHMTSYDKSDQKGGALNFTNTNQKALPYDSDSTNSGQPQRVRKPPRHDRPHSRSARGPSRYSSSERDEPPKRFHNIESQSFGPYGVVARARSGSRASTEPGGSGNGNKTPSYRSRSMSRSPQYAEAKRDLKASRELNKSTGDIMRSDLDNERAGRLRRAMSFKDTSKSAGSEYSATGSGANQQPKSSFLDSMKSLYGTLSKAALSKLPKNKGMEPSSPPKRPPRKPRSQSSMSDHHRSMSSLNTTTRQDHRSMSSLTRSAPAPQPSSRTLIDGRQWDVHSSTTSSTLPRSASTTTRPTPTPRNGSQPRSSVSKTRLSISGASARSSSVEPNNPYMANSGFRENRDPPRFERQRDNTNRFFGQAGSDMNDDSEVVERSRPPPDMRRFLLDNLNTRRNTSSNNVNTSTKQPSVISSY